MKTPKPALLIVVLLVFSVLLYVIYVYKSRPDGFNSEIMAHFQNMTPDSKAIVCENLNDQLKSYKAQLETAAPEQKPTMQLEIYEMEKTAKSYGC